VVGFVLSGFAVVAVLAVAPEAAEASPEPTGINGSAYCDAEGGTWQLHYFIENQSPSTVVIESAVDAVTGAVLTPTRTQLPSFSGAEVMTVAAATATNAGLTVTLRRSDRSQSTRLTEQLLLPAGCAAKPATPCVTTTAARYRHTLDMIRGVATVELVGPRLCPGQFDPVIAEVRTPDGDLYDFGGRGFDSRVTKASFSVNRPRCGSELRLFFEPSGGAYEDPRWNLGGTAAPGNRSAGPLGRQPLAGPACQPLPTVSLTAQCDRTFIARFTNGAAANLPARFWYGEMAGEQTVYLKLFTLEPGESFSVVIRPAQPTNTVFANSMTGGTLRGWWQTSAMCERRQAPPISPPRPPIPRR
jgi:hypothetical protein